MRRVSDSAGPMSRLALSPRIVWPSLPPYEVGAPKRVITELNGWPACTPVNAYSAALRPRRHDSGPWWVATAFHVRLFHPLLHAGLARRSWCPRNLRNLGLEFEEPYCAKLIGGTAVVWATGERICEPAPDTWDYCRDYHGPQVAKEVRVRSVC